MRYNYKLILVIVLCVRYVLEVIQAEVMKGRYSHNIFMLFVYSISIKYIYYTNYTNSSILSFLSDILKLQKERKLGSSLIGVLVPPPYDKTNVKTKNSRILKNRIGRPLLLMKEEIAILKGIDYRVTIT